MSEDSDVAAPGVLPPLTAATSSVANAADTTEDRRELQDILKQWLTANPEISDAAVFVSEAVFDTLQDS